MFVRSRTAQDRGWLRLEVALEVADRALGAKTATDKDPTLLPDLKVLVQSTTRGDPESPLLWTARSQRNLVVALKKQGHSTTWKMVSRLLKELGYSL